MESLSNASRASLQLHNGVVEDANHSEKLSHRGTVQREDEEEVLIEPRFKYSRLLNDISKLFDSDSASCIAVHEKFIAIGCKSGRICIFDQLGNVNRESAARHHKCEVTAISIDSSGSYYASCANDYTVSIFGIGGSDYNERIEGLKLPAKSIALAGDFSRQGSGQRLAIGNRDLLLYETTFPLRRRRITPLYEGLDRDGQISAISWLGANIAFTNESGTRIYDIKLGKNVTLIQPMHKIERFYSSKFPPRHVWLDENTFAIGWANTICVCGIRDRRPDRPNDFPQRHGYLLHRWELNDLFVAGLSFTLCEDTSSSPSGSLMGSRANSTLSVLNGHAGGRRWQEIVVFGIKVPAGKQEEEALSDTQSITSSDPSTSSAFVQSCGAQKHETQLTLLHPGASIADYQIVAEDGIEMRGAELKRLQHFSLAALPNDSLYYLLGPKEIIESCPCSPDDRITWLVDNQLYTEAMEFARRNLEHLSKWSIREVGRRLISYLVQEKRDFTRAAKWLPTICGRSGTEWDYYFEEFENCNHTLKLVPFLPTQEPRLEPERYESVLTAALYARPKLFLSLITEWSPELYRVVIGSIADKTVRRLTEAHRGNTPRLESVEFHELSKSLALLYTHDRQFKKAINIYMTLRDPEVFTVVGKHKQFQHVSDKVCELMEINSDLAIRLLLDNEDSVPPRKILNTLGNYPKLQMAYLNSLLSRGEGAEYSDMLVELYIKHDRPKLLPFLRKGESYKIDRALELCRSKKYHEEAVYLLGRSGNRLAALDLIVNELKRFDLAIDFCIEHEYDVELWNKLIDLAMENAAHISMLLSSAGAFVSPLRIIEKIPPQMEIPNAKDVLMKVLRDATLQIRILGDMRYAGDEDNLKLFLQRLHPPIYEVGEEECCKLCKSLILAESPSSRGCDVAIFGCGHVVHGKCLTAHLISAPTTTPQASPTEREEDGLEEETGEEFDPSNPFSQSSALFARRSLAIGIESDDLCPACPSCYENCVKEVCGGSSNHIS